MTLKTASPNVLLPLLTSSFGLQAEMKALDENSSLGDAEKDREAKVLINRFYCESGPAKCKETLEHLSGLLEAGEHL